MTFSWVSNYDFQLGFSSHQSQTSDSAFPECLTNCTLHSISSDMASSTTDIDFKSIGKRCLEICQESHSIGLVVKMSMNIGSAFSFNFCSETNGSLPLPTDFDKSRKKTKSPSTKRRDLTRLTAFRNKKAASPGVPLASEFSPLDLPIVIPSQKESHAPSTSASLDRRSFDLDANVPETSMDPSVPPPAYSEPSFPSTANNEDNLNSLCVCQTTSCNCLASKPLSPKRIVPKFKIKKTEDGWKTSHSLCDNCDQPFLNSSHICGDNSDIDEIQSENMSGPCVDQDSLDCTCSDHERHKMLMKTCGVS